MAGSAASAFGRKKIRFDYIDVDPKQFALIVSYFNCDESTGESQPGQKSIKLPRGLSNQDLSALAQEVVDKCKYIPASKIGEVERLLQKLMEYEIVNGSGQRPNHSPTKSAPSQREPPPCHQGQTIRPTRQEPLLPDADVRFIDEYADQLYEERMDLKVHGAKCILRVCTEAKNLEFIADHETLLGVLSRELRESSKKSNELCVAIACTFLCFSHFSEFHPVLMQHNCGDVTMRVIEYESKRYQVRKDEIQKQQLRIQELSDTASKDDKKQLAREEKKYKIQLNKQNKLMYVCQMVLLNLAEEISVERKMVNRKMPHLLIQLLDRAQDDLLLVALQFLKKLSVFEENKEQISTPETLARLYQLSSHGNIRIALLSLRTLYNLSFDANIRASLIESGILNLLVDLLRNPPFRHIVLRLLYHFSMDDRCKSLMAYYQEGMVMLLQLVVHFPESRVGKDLVALVVNLATHPRCAEVMVNCGLFPQVMLRELKTRDPLLCKVIRHVSSHKDVVEPMYELLSSESVRMSKWIFEFLRMALCSVDNPDLVLEVLGTLTNLTLPDIPWGELCETGLIDLLHRLLVGGFSEDDIVIECVMLIGNLGLCREASQHVVDSRLPGMLQELLVEKREDEEIILQLLFTFECLLTHEEARDAILQSSEIAPCIMRFVQSRHPAVAEQTSRTLEIFMQCIGDMAAESPECEMPEWAEQLKAYRFEQHNVQWCHYINRELNGGGGMSPSGGYCDDEDSVGEEEEFAFHWAGGDVADVADLANREWRNEDLGGYMYSSRRFA